MFHWCAWCGQRPVKKELLMDSSICKHSVDLEEDQSWPTCQNWVTLWLGYGIQQQHIPNHQLTQRQCLHGSVA